MVIAFGQVAARAWRDPTQLCHGRGDPGGIASCIGQVGRREEGRAATRSERQPLSRGIVGPLEQRDDLLVDLVG